MTELLTATQDAQTNLRSAKKLADAERRCVVSGALLPRASLIRFVIGPDSVVVPDLAEKLPGSGLWVTASAESVTTAIKKNLFAKAARSPANPAADLVSQTASLLRARCLSLLGLAKGAGIATLGEKQTETGLRDGSIAFYLYAPDATRVLDNRHNVPECSFFSREEMGTAFGYEVIVYAGLGAHGLTRKLKDELARLISMTERKIQAIDASHTENEG